MQLSPTLFFTGNAEEALEFYRDALGGRIAIQRYKDAPPESGQSSPDFADKVMYGTLTSPFGTISAMDAPPDRAGTPGDNFGISISGEEENLMSKAFTKLAESGRVIMPYGKTFFAANFGMTKDKFGITWLVSSQLVAMPT